MEAQVEPSWVNFLRPDCSLQCMFMSCNKSISNISQLRDHLYEHLVEFVKHGFTENCPITGCGVQVTDQAALYRHISFHVVHAGLQLRGLKFLMGRRFNENNFSTGACSRTDGTFTRIFYGGEPVACGWEKCEFEFDTIEAFFSHVRSHANDTRFSDDFPCFWKDCTSVLRNMHGMVPHLRHHSGEKMVACPFCGCCYSSNSRLIDHIDRQATNNLQANATSGPSKTPTDSELVCKHCDKVFISVRLLKDHCRHHVYHYKCPFCQLSLETPSSLRKHVYHRHSDVKTFDCPKCNKQFKQRADLQMHLQVLHYGGKEKLFGCEECGTKFKWKSSLYEHKRKHENGESGTATYACHMCDKKFIRGFTLSNHLVMKHQLQKPPGHKRFKYLRRPDGYFRVLTERYESAELVEGSGLLPVKSQIMEEKGSMSTAISQLLPLVPEDPNEPYESDANSPGISVENRTPPPVRDNPEGPEAAPNPTFLQDDDGYLYILTQDSDSGNMELQQVTAISTVQGTIVSQQPTSDLETLSNVVANVVSQTNHELLQRSQLPIDPEVL